MKFQPFLDILCGANKPPYWDKLFGEYLDLCEDGSTKSTIILMRDIAVITNKLILTEAIVSQLADGWDEGLIAALRTLGFRFPYTIETLDEDLVNTINQCKQLVVRLKQRKYELSELQGENKQPTQSDYDVYLSELSKFQGYRVDPNIVTVSEFCAIVKRFKQQNKPNGR